MGPIAPEDYKNPYKILEVANDATDGAIQHAANKRERETMTGTGYPDGPAGDQHRIRDRELIRKSKEQLLNPEERKRVNAELGINAGQPTLPQKDSNIKDAQDEAYHQHAQEEYYRKHARSLDDPTTGDAYLSKQGFANLTALVWMFFMRDDGNKLCVFDKGPDGKWGLQWNTGLKASSFFGNPNPVDENGKPLKFWENPNKYLLKRFEDKLVGNKGMFEDFNNMGLFGRNVLEPMDEATYQNMDQKNEEAYNKFIEKYQRSGKVEVDPKTGMLNWKDPVAAQEAAKRMNEFMGAAQRYRAPAPPPPSLGHGPRPPSGP